MEVKGTYKLLGSNYSLGRVLGHGWRNGTLALYVLLYFSKEAETDTAKY